MKDYSYVFNAHPNFIDSIFAKYKNDPTSVEDGWRVFFEGFEFSSDLNGHAESAGINEKELSVLSIIYGFRSRGHLLSTTNPIMERRDRKPFLDLKDYNLSEDDMNTTFKVGEHIGLKNATLRQILDQLRAIYSGNIGFEFAHIEDREKRHWLLSKIEGMSTTGDRGLDLDSKKRILEKLNGAVVFEKFLHTKYVGQKRFSLEGGETTIAALDAILNFGADHGVEGAVIGMAHRGRLNVLANIMGKTYDHIFTEFEGTEIPKLSFGDGDVKYHLGYASEMITTSGKSVNLQLVPNPSHLESVDPVVQGFSRAKADMVYGSDYDKILPILIHGDAAVAGQGVVYETVQMSQLDGYYTGGTIHFVINNQIGFTTDFDDARSSTYSTAAASLVQAPVFHVNGDDPEAVIFVSRLAMEYRQKFNNDVFIDMVCYRRHGHNEGDDPKFTQPHMYEIIKNHPNPREIYSKILIERGDVDGKLAENMETSFWSLLQDRLNYVKETEVPYHLQEPEKEWIKMKFTYDVNDFQSSPKTGISKVRIKKIIDHLMTIPKELNQLSKVDRLQKGKQKLVDQNLLDWGMAELLAYGSILLEGKDVRMSGQDVKRGTFSHRHAVFNDIKTNQAFNRLEGLSDDQGKFMIYNSLLSEFAVLGFEYGYSHARPHGLTLWEAQFGDFYNGAQTIVDQYLAAGESKWQRMNGLIMLLPHGYEGQGPEHSSARIERFLQATAECNMVITNLTTPANLFHAFRRQLEWSFRKPLIIMSPKSLLRHPKVVSDISDFETNNKFQEVIDDPSAIAAKIKKLLFCSGKVYYDLLEKKENDKRDDVAIVRIEQLYPFPQNQIDAILKKYAKAHKIWVQEENRNMGAWDFLMRYWRNTDIQLISRKYGASPATGYKKIHDEEQNELVEDAFS